MSQSRALSNAQVLRAALIVLLGFLASGVLGFIRTAVLSAQFGAGEALEAFYAAQRIPEIIFVLVAGGALGSSFIPIYAQRRKEDEEQAWWLASAVMTLAACAAAVLGSLVVLFADPLVTRFLLSDSPADVQHLAVNLVRLMMITPFIFSISGLIMGILQSHGLFLLPSVAISMNSIGIIIGALWIAPMVASAPYEAADLITQSSESLSHMQVLPVDQVGASSVYGLAYGAILSALLHLAVQIPGLFRIRAKLFPFFNPRYPGVWDVLRLMGPRVLGLAVIQVNFLVNIILANGMVTGSYVALNTAFILMFTALGIIGQSVGSAVFPTLSALYAEGDLAGYRDRLARAMRSVLFLAYPATVVFIVMGEPVVSIFERGEWIPEHTAATAWALAFYAIGIAGFALLEILSRAFYALSDTFTPVLAGIGAMLSNIVLSIILIRFIGDPDNLARGPFAGLALANAVTTLAEAGVLWWLMHRRIGGLNDRYILSGSWRAILASLMMGMVLWGVDQSTSIEGFMLVVVGGLVGGPVFFVVSMILGLEEAKMVPSMLLRRRGR